MFQCATEADLEALESRLGGQIKRKFEDGRLTKSEQKDNKQNIQQVEAKLTKKISDGIDSLGEIIKEYARGHKKLLEKVAKVEQKLSRE